MSDTPDLEFGSPSNDTDILGSGSEHDAVDKWRRDKISFPTVTDALLANFAFSIFVHPTDVDQLFRILQDPRFDPAERTLNSLEEIHSFAHDFRKSKSQKFPDGELQTSTLVWEAVISRIGSRWVDFVSTLYEDAAEHYHIADIFNDRRIETQDVLDLRSMTLVHRSLTHLAQQQLGRVLLLHEPTEGVFVSALRSPLFGNWTQILAIRGCNNLPIPTLLKTLVRRLPRLARVYLKTTLTLYPRKFLDALTATHSLTTICIILDNYEPHNLSEGFLSLLPRCRGLTNLYLVGFAWRPDIVKFLDKVASTHNLTFSSVLIKAFRGYLDPNTFLQSIRLGRDSEKSLFLQGIHIQKVQFGEETVNFGTLLDNSIKSSLQKTEEVRLDFLNDLERDQILYLSKAIRCLAWCVDDFCPMDNQVPDLLFPPSLHKFKLVVRAIQGFDFHAHDRKLQSLIQRNKDSNLKELAFSVGFRSSEKDIFLEEEEGEFPHIYFPRTSRLCKALGVLITSRQDWNES